MDRRRAAGVLLGSNLPLMLWTAYAAWIAVAGAGSGVGCLIHPALGWCPGCGLTGDYARILTLNQPEGWYIWVILSAFSFNALWSIQKAKRVALGRPAIHASVVDLA